MMRYTLWHIYDINAINSQDLFYFNSFLFDNVFNFHARITAFHKCELKININNWQLNYSGLNGDLIINVYLIN